ncbi:Peptidase, M23/M37 family [Rhodovulum sp. P5]|uniref:M23 family metallopeptidase n=1 Tax=Rhodovulum sp. P5 TaxID=1564506 RepID=UPI0009C23CD3|nr:M23 family metallopeptidase [Rhodovulum sp. P5]ARE42031.1 Peptidase, M23/M37 family [Rhodovulum sp. P5]
MTARLIHRFDVALGRYIPEQRLFLRSEDSTRFVRLTPSSIFLIGSGAAVLVAWAMISSALLLMDGIGAGNLREQARRDQALYDTRINALAEERDRRVEEVLAAQERFSLAMAEVSKMQSALLASEERRRELETGIEVVQKTLRRTLAERDQARAAQAQLVAKIEGTEQGDDTAKPRTADMQDMLAFLSSALDTAAMERETVAADAAAAYELAEALAYERKLVEQRNDRIFNTLEEALAISVEPLDKMFRKAGLSTDELIDEVREGYNGIGGPLVPIAVSSKGSAATPTADELRASELLNRLDELNLYRIAAEKLPFAMPLKSAFRYTSPFGMRRHPTTGRYSMHEGADMAAGHGTPIYATADGVVTKAGWVSGYGRMVKIKHEFGLETRYGHLSRLRVKEGQRVSRGDRIGDMGSSGRSTGTHLHYEVRVGDTPVNPTTYIKAARDVF